jgi:hypothetical protein
LKLSNSRYEVIWRVVDHYPFLPLRGFSMSYLGRDGEDRVRDTPRPQSAGLGAIARLPAGCPATTGGTGQSWTLPESQYNAQRQQLNQNADPSAAGQAGNAGTPPDQTATNQPYALPGANADEQYQYAFDLIRLSPNGASRIRSGVGSSRGRGRGSS